MIFLSKSSKASYLYRVLNQNFDLTHWQIRSILIQRLGFNQKQLQPVMKRNRRRIRERDESIISAIFDEIKDMKYSEQVIRLRYLQHLNSIEWATMSDIIRRLNQFEPSQRRQRWSKFNSLRQSEVIRALKLYDELMIGAWLRLQGHASASIIESDYFEQNSAKPSYMTDAWELSTEVKKCP